MNEAIQLANDRPTSLSDDLYQWGTDAESMIRSQAAEIERLRENLTVTHDAVEKILLQKAAEIERLKLDAERLDFLEHNLFGKKWNGVIDSGSKTYWQIWSGYQHITHAMVGHTFRQAIDAARAALENKHD